MSSCRQAVVKLSSSCCQIQKYKNTQNNSPAPAINTQKDKKSKKIKNAKIQKEKNMQKEQQNKKKLLSRQLLVLRTCYYHCSHKITI